MKKLLPLLCLLFLFSAAFGQDIAALDKKNGFRDAVFGSSISSYSGMVLYKKENFGVVVYTRATDSKKIGTDDIDKITYKFFRDKLYATSFYFRGGDAHLNALGILSTLQEAYGKPSRSFRQGTYEIRKWTGSKVEMTFMYDRFDGIGSVNTDHLPTEAVIRALDPANSRKATDDL